MYRYRYISENREGINFMLDLICHKKLSYGDFASICEKIIKDGKVWDYKSSSNRDLMIKGFAMNGLKSAKENIRFSYRKFDN